MDFSRYRQAQFARDFRLIASVRAIYRRLEAIL